MTTKLHSADNMRSLAALGMRVKLKCADDMRSLAALGMTVLFWGVGGKRRRLAQASLLLFPPPK